MYIEYRERYKRKISIDRYIDRHIDRYRYTLLHEINTTWLLTRMEFFPR